MGYNHHSPAIRFATTGKPTANSDSTDPAQRIIFQNLFSNIPERKIRFGDSFNMYHIDTRDSLHREIRQRVSFRPHPRKRLQCATTLRGGCTASFRTIEELVNHLVEKYGNLKNSPGKLDLLVYCPLNGRCPYCKLALIHIINLVGKCKLCYAVPCPKTIVGADMKCSQCKKHFMTHDSNYTHDTSCRHVGYRLQ